MNRRDFLKVSGTVAAVTGVSAIALGEAPLQTSPRTASSQQQVLVNPFSPQTMTLNVNGKDYKVQVEPRGLLVDVLRDNMGLMATKRPCNRGECGGCTVLIDGVPYYSCSVLAITAGNKKILTAEATDPVLQALQNAWVQTDASQCAYCSPGFLMAATALLKSNPKPSVGDIKNALSGNLCRCGNYIHIIEGVQLASKTLAGGSA